MMESSESSVPEVLQPLCVWPIQNYSHFTDPLARLAKYTRYTRMYQTYLDRTTPHTLYRWLATAGLISLFLLRVVLSQGVSGIYLERVSILLTSVLQWYIVCCTLGSRPLMALL